MNTTVINAVNNAVDLVNGMWLDNTNWRFKADAEMDMAAATVMINNLSDNCNLKPIR